MLIYIPCRADIAKSHAHCLQLAGVVAMFRVMNLELYQIWCLLLYLAIVAAMVSVMRLEMYPTRCRVLLVASVVVIVRVLRLEVYQTGCRPVHSSSKLCSSNERWLTEFP